MTHSVGWVGVYEYYRGGNTARQRIVELYVVLTLWSSTRVLQLRPSGWRVLRICHRWRHSLMTSHITPRDPYYNVTSSNVTRASRGFSTTAQLLIVTTNWNHAATRQTDWQTEFLHQWCAMRTASRGKNQQLFGRAVSAYSECKDATWQHETSVNVNSFCRSQHTVWVKKITPWGYLTFFSFFYKRLRIFNRFCTHLLYVPIYARLQIFSQLPPTLTKLCHIKHDYLVHIICSKCPPSAETHAFRRLRKSLIALSTIVCGKSL